MCQPDSAGRTEYIKLNVFDMSCPGPFHSVLDANDNGLIYFDFKRITAVNNTERFYESGKIKLFAGGRAASQTCRLSPDDKPICPGLLP